MKVAVRWVVRNHRIIARGKLGASLQVQGYRNGGYWF